MPVYLKTILALFIVICAGCSSIDYVTPGEPANLADINREDIAEIMAKKPVANFPARIAVIRIQASGYVSYSTESYNAGGFSIVSVKELGADKALNTMQNWPQVMAASPINQLLLSPNMKSLDDLRLSAAKLHADILMIYTIDTKFHVNEKAHASLSLLSLGMMPDRNANVTSTASAIFVDVRTGFTYGAVEATAKATGLANAWTSESAIDNKRLEAEQKAFDELMLSSEKTWQSIVKQYVPVNTKEQ